MDYIRTQRDYMHDSDAQHACLDTSRERQKTTANVRDRRGAQESYLSLSGKD